MAYAEALRADGDLAAARAAAVRARDGVLARAARLDDPGLRASFLARVPDNARALSLAAELAPEA